MNLTLVQVTLHGGVRAISYASLARRLKDKGPPIFLDLGDRTDAVHTGATASADPRQIDPGFVAHFNLDAIEQGAPRAPTSAAIEFVSSAFLFALGLSRIQEIDQVAAMHEDRSAVIHGAEPCPYPSPNGVPMEVKQIGNL